MANIIDLRGSGGQLVLLGSALGLPTSNAVAFEVNTPIVAGSIRFNHTLNRIEFIGTESENWIGLEAGGGGSIPAGGLTGNALIKASNADHDVAWGAVASAVHNHDASAIVTGTLNDARLSANVAMIGHHHDGRYLPMAVTLNLQTGTTYNLASGDVGSYVRCTNAAAITVTVPLQATVPYPIGTQIIVTQGGDGQVTFVGEGAVVINASETLKLRKKFSSASLIKVGTDEWDLVGDLEALP